MERIGATHSERGALAESSGLASRLHVSGWAFTVRDLPDRRLLSRHEAGPATATTESKVSRSNDAL
jgi:hypothetical protein